MYSVSIIDPENRILKVQWNLKLYALPVIAESQSSIRRIGY